MEVAERLNVPLFAETQFYKRSHNRRFTLDRFGLQCQMLRGRQLYESLKISKYYWRDFFLGSDSLKMSPILFDEAHFEYDYRITDVTSPVYLSGYWQSERYFPSVAEQLKKEIQIPPSSAVKSLADEIDEQAVCLHVRRGDFFHNPLISRINGVCDKEYYATAIRALKERLSNPRFYVFTDEPGAVDFVSDLVEGPVMVGEYTNGDDLAEFSLMQKFGNFIIANSTFSWWAAWSSFSDNKIVVCPSRWFADTSINSNDLYPAGWLRF